MKIAIIGAGNVGATLGRRFVEAGHEVHYGVRTPEADKYDALRGERSTVASVRDAVAASEAALLATPWAAAEDALNAAGDFGDKVLIDATNPIGPGFVLTHGHDDSGAEQVQRWATNARVVKAFNTTGAENMSDPAYEAGPVAMFVCGDDDSARATAMGLASDIGFDAVASGPLENARLLEPTAMLWIKLALVLGHGRGIGFGLMRR